MSALGRVRHHRGDRRHRPEHRRGDRRPPGPDRRWSTPSWPRCWTTSTVAAVKTGMLATTATVRLVADRAADGRLPVLVVDPVMVASTGRRLLDDDAVAAYRDRLVPHALVVTPNLFEAAILAGVEPMARRRRRHHGRPGHADPPPRADLGAGEGRPPARRPRAGRGSAPDRVADVLFDGTDVLVLDDSPGRHPQQPRHRVQPGLGHRRPVGDRVRRARPPWPGPRTFVHAGPTSGRRGGSWAGATGRSTRSAGPGERPDEPLTRDGSAGTTEAGPRGPASVSPRNPPVLRCGSAHWTGTPSPG